MNNDNPLVSICTLTYNHERYIEQAILSVLEQKHDFKIEFVIGDDCSTDKTREIIKRYSAQYPDVIVEQFSETNVGPKINAINCLHRCRGKYIAFMEGDDYWTDPNKLQKQVNFMEANPEFSMCFTDAGIIDEIGLSRPNPFRIPPKEEFTIEDVIMAENVFMPTATVFVRNELPDPLPEFFKDAISGDIAVHIMVSDKGKIKYLPGQTAMYRQHSGGMTKSQYVIDNAYREQFKLYVEANEYYNYKYDAIFRKRLGIMAKTMLIYFSTEKKGLEKFRHVMKNARNYFKYTPGINIKEILYYSVLLSFPSLLKLKKNN